MDPARLRRSRLAALLLGLVPLAGCDADRASVVLAATTSTYDSGLLERLVRAYQEAHPERRIRTVVVGSGEALELGRRGDADVLLVHAPEAENRFVEAGHALERTPVMYNGFVIVGPAEDPVGIRDLADPSDALRRVAAARASFVSRGDGSGTHERELALWREAGVSPDGPWYIESGQGQGTSLQLASERRAYTLTDEATFRVLARLLDLAPLVEGDGSLLNLYSALVTRAGRRPREGAAFVEWLTSEAGRAVIATFGVGEGGAPLFTPLLVGTRLPIPAPHGGSDPAELQAPDSISGGPGAPAGRAGARNLRQAG